ncbi:uncharacterized distant relative of homeotic protein bithoraxoid [Longilinea arvoryzae]|uniref:Uncharacterized distant relative of homeotic protein bithoraxoid n=1 Tax=Longilinea arvoryzae TaxID=360412 RepID=A0A0S7BBH9_9CHLR|nr:roadblock/LC7 domain-containing protein [Longilinea arvoryzae]GAP12589.1 uncharacterized distant relative of homeotic protein bithoraxoid [Longilinea arvoryzae]
MSKLDQLLQDIHNELGADLQFIEIVGSDGLSIADEQFINIDTSVVAARFTMVAKLAAKVADKLNIGEVEDNLISTNTGMVLINELGDGSYIALLGLSNDAPLGVARMVIHDYDAQLWDAIPR